MATQPGPWPDWTEVYAGALALLREEREAQLERKAAAQLSRTPAPGPELDLLAQAVADLVVVAICSADPSRRARLRPLLLALLAETQAIDGEVAA